MAAGKKQEMDFKMLRQVCTGIQSEEQERFHAYHEVYYVSEGRCSVFIGRRTYHLREGDFAVIPAGVLHKTDFLSLGHNMKYVVSFSRRTADQIDTFLGEILTPECLHAGRITAPVQRREAISTVLNRMLYEYENQPLHAMSFCKACLAELLISLLRYRTHEEESTDPVNAETDRMQSVADYICEHISEDLSLTQIASEFALSTSFLSKSFRQATGFGVKEYIIHLRIQQASDLLLNTHLSITEIADRCGFNDSNYFGDAFKKATGLSPREFRKLG